MSNEPPASDDREPATDAPDDGSPAEAGEKPPGPATEPHPGPTPLGPGPTPVCRRCATVVTGPGAFCPRCGARYRRRGWGSWSRRARIGVVAALVLLLLGGAGSAVVLKVRSDRAAEHQRAAAAHRAKVAAERKRRAAREQAQKREQAAALDRIERKMRQSLVHGLRKSITKDARERVDEGILDGPILSTSCDNTDGHEEDLDAHQGEYECLAATEKHAGGEASGYRFSARVDYEEGSYTWHLGG